LSVNRPRRLKLRHHFHGEAHDAIKRSSSLNKESSCIIDVN